MSNDVDHTTSRCKGPASAAEKRATAVAWRSVDSSDKLAEINCRINKVTTAAADHITNALVCFDFAPRCAHTANNTAAARYSQTLRDPDRFARASRETVAAPSVDTFRRRVQPR